MTTNWIFPIKERFKLSDRFIEQFKGKQPNWGPLGYVTYKRTYSRPLPDGSTEEFWQTLQRVVEGCYTTQLNHCKQTRLPWNAYKAQRSAQEMYQRMWDFKFLPPGRGLWMMGTDFVWERGSGGLNNCAFVSTKDIDIEGAEPFAFMMDMSMLGVGVAFDTLGAGKVNIVEPKLTDELFVVEDSKGGWASVAERVVSAYFGKAKLPVFDYSLIRPAGSPIMGFGGIAPGPGPLIRMEEEMRQVFSENIGKPISSTLIVDVMNIIGKSVVSGGVRRTSQLVLGLPDDEEYLMLKDPDVAGDKMLKWRWSSNNSVYSEVGMDYVRTATQAGVNGEPGFVWLNNCQHYGRIKDGWGDHDTQVVGVNPCLTGDTLVATADGRGHVRIDQIEDSTPVYCVDNEGNIAIRPMRHPRITGYNVPVYKVLLDDGSVVKATANHKFLLTDGTYRELQDLLPGESLRILTRYTPDFRSESRADQYIQLSFKGKILTEHIEIAKYHSGVEDLEGNHIHHRDGNKLNNNPSNLGIEPNIEHLQGHSQGLGNPRAYEILNEELLEEGIAFAKTLGRRFSVNEWQAYALANGLPSQFSDFRVRDLGTVEAFSKRCATLAGIELPDVDPRTLKFFIECVSAGYDADIVNGVVTVAKTCEVCKNPFTIEATRREQCVCGHTCSNKIRDYSKNKEGQKKAFNQRKEEMREKQAKIILDLKFKNGGCWPQKIDWVKACKAQNISPEISRKSSPFRSYEDLKEYAENMNHRVVSVTYIGEENVWNGTVDDYHNFFLGGFEGKTPHGRDKVCYINSTQCGEQSLEGYELCNLVETFPSNHDTFEDYKQTLKYAYLFGKTVTLIPTHNERTNAVIWKNRRIGLSQSGIIQSFQKHGRRTHLEWCDKGYEYLKHLDRNVYSPWLGIPHSKKMSTVKPSGCRPGDALTATTGGLLTLEELLENHPSNQEWYEAPQIAVYQEGNTENKVLRTYRNGVSPLVQIKLAHNLAFRSTPNHLWYVKSHYKNHKHYPVDKWVRADELRKNDVLDLNMVAYRSERPSALISVPKPETVEGKRGYVVDFPQYMNGDLAWLFGYLWGNGAQSICKYRIRFIDYYRDCIEKVQSVLETQFGLKGEIHRLTDRDAWSLELGSKHLWDWMEANGLMKYSSFGELSNIPRVIRASAKEHIIAFMSGMCDADACFSIKEGSKGKVVFSTANAEFAEHFQQVGWAVGLTFGRSHNTKGKNLQKQKSMWLMGLASTCDRNAVKTFKRYSVGIARSEAKQDCRWNFEEEPHRVTRILGKVEQVTPCADAETFDIEVANDHWYYAGCVKSHNTVSLLPGVTPGIHYPHSEYYKRAIRVDQNSPLIPILQKAGYPNEPSAYGDNSIVFYFPVHEKYFERSKNDVTIWEQMENAAQLQYYWSDNNISVTVTFDPETEAVDIPKVLELYETRLKVVSFLPRKDHGYVQAPYQEISKEEYEDMVKLLKPIEFVAEDIHDTDEKFCTNDSCEIQPKNDK
jgi:ribonucleotide reductase alpha subunit